MAALVALTLVPAGTSRAVSAGMPGVETGKSGLPVPRFVSLKSDKVNVRGGPGEDYKIEWVFTRSGLPIEVIQEFDNWRRIRNSDGAVGWVLQNLLSGRRTAVVSPWAKGDARPIRYSASPDASVAAYLQPGVLGGVDRCHDGWCRISGKGFTGWIPQDQLWGVYSNEEIE